MSVPLASYIAVQCFRLCESESCNESVHQCKYLSRVGTQVTSPYQILPSFIPILSLDYCQLYPIYFPYISKILPTSTKRFHSQIVSSSHSIRFNILLPFLFIPSQIRSFLDPYKFTLVLSSSFPIVQLYIGLCCFQQRITKLVNWC